MYRSHARHADAITGTNCRALEQLFAPDPPPLQNKDHHNFTMHRSAFVYVRNRMLTTMLVMLLASARPLNPIVCSAFSSTSSNVSYHAMNLAFQRYASKQTLPLRIRPVFSASTRTATGAPTAVKMSNEESASTVSNHFDYLVIGAGSGGIASARRAASYGKKVAVIEKGRLGGTCVNVGCVPKKVMWNAASIAETLHDMKHYGFSLDNDAKFSWKFLKDARDRYILRLNGIYAGNMENSKVVSISGTASFISPNTVQVLSDAEGKESGGSVTYTADHILISTGGYPAFPPGDGILEHSISSDGFFELEDLPKKVVVVGAGYIAVELAGGADTSLVVRRQKALREFDDMIADQLDEEMQKQGIKIFRNTNGVRSIKSDGLKKTVLLQNGEEITDVDTVIMAAGRAPLVEPLNLPAAGVSLNEHKGTIVVNEYSETTAKGVYAVGDVCGNVELTPMAIAAGRRLADRLFGGPEWKNAKVSYENVPTVVFSHPPIGTIGLTEKQAINKYGQESIKVYKSKFANLFYGPWQVQQDEKPKTAMKLICAGETELVVGLHVIGMGADEMLQGFGIAMKMGATKADFDSCIAIHPTAAEEFVTLFPWGLSKQETGAKVSPLNGSPNPEPKIAVSS